MAPSPTIRRLLKETQELSSAAKHPNPTFHAAPVSEDNLHEWHFTLLGPPAPSPYAGGIYHGRISLPPAYPMKPPNFRFLTPSGRFEVNREICLSISGFHEETWQPAWGVRLALTALRGFMGEEGTAGQVGGLEAPKEVRERMAKESKLWKCQSCEIEEPRTNEERMKWWWDICRENGVDVEAEISGMESLPADMKLETRETKGKQKETDVAGSHRADEHASQQGKPAQISQSSPDIQDSAGLRTHPSAAEVQRHLQDGTAQANALVTVTQQIQATEAQRQRQNDSPITIDRAIGVVFLALCLMILKKLFYPSTTSSLLGGYDELQMMRE